MTPLERPRTTLARRRNREAATPNADGSPLEGFVEVPADGEAVDRRTVVSGWHAWEGEPVAAISIELDGVLVGGARRSRTPRDDVAAERGGAYTRTGWVADLDLRHVAAETATIVVTVHPHAAHRGVPLDPITVTVLGEQTVDERGEPIPPPHEVRGRVDVPTTGARVAAGPLLVRGWARCTSGAPVARVDVAIGATPRGRARLGLDRADAALADDAADAPVRGFELLVDLSAVPPGSTAVTATAVALDGTTAALTTHVTVVGAATSAAAVPALPTPTRSAASTSVLVVTHDLALGGAQLWLAEALRAMGAGRAFGCTVVAFRSGPLADELAAAGVEVHVSSAPPVDDLAGYEGRLEELAAWLAPRQHTAALVNTFRAFPGADLAQRLALPVVWAIHESWPEPLIWAFDHPGVVVDPTVRALAARALAGSGAVVFEAEATRALYAPRAPERTVVVPYGVDTAALDELAGSLPRAAARRALRLAPAERALLMMGTIEPRKGQGLLALAFAQVAARHPGATLALVGDLATPYSAAVRAAVERAGIARRVQIVPVTGEAAVWYRACDALVCASDTESLPRSVLDAMALGMPVVSTRVFGLGELLVDGETAVCFEPNDLRSAVAALDRVLSMDAGELAAIGRRGRDLVRARHDAAGYAHDLRALLDGLARDPEADPASILAAAPRLAQSVSS